MNTNTTQTTEAQIEHRSQGPAGEGTITRRPNGGRTVSLALHNGETTTTDGARVDFHARKAGTLQEALDLACQDGWLPLYRVENIDGTKALIVAYTKEPLGPKAEGYAIRVRRGVRALRFRLNRLELEKMGCTGVREALEKAAFETGDVEIRRA